MKKNEAVFSFSAEVFTLSEPELSEGELWKLRKTAASFLARESPAGRFGVTFSAKGDLISEILPRKIFQLYI